jgi:hypothetical protein
VRQARDPVPAPDPASRTPPAQALACPVPEQPVQSFGLSRNAEEARTDDHGTFCELWDSPARSIQHPASGVAWLPSKTRQAHSI